MSVSILAALLASVLVFAAARLGAPRVAAKLPRLRERGRGLLSRLGARLPARWVAEAERRIVAAGSPERFRPEGALLATFGLAACAAFLWAVHVISGAPLLLLVATTMAPAFPWLWLSHRARERQVAIARELPFVLDLLTLVVEAGNDLLTGLARVAERLKAGPLRDELVHALRELKMGRAKREVFAALSARTGSKEIGRMVAAILQADRMGAPVGESLRILSTQILSERFLLAEKKAAQAPVKMLFPLVAFIFPAVFLVLFGPIVLALYAR